MRTGILPVENKILVKSGHIPCVSLILPFEPKMSLKNELQYKLKLILGRVESELLVSYTEDKALAVLRRLRMLVKTLDYNTHKKSIAIFASPVLEKIYYLDIAVEEKIIIDDSFEIRDLVYSKKEMHKYLLLVLSSKQCRTYLGNQNQFIRIVSNLPEHVAAFKNDIPQRVANFSDPAQRKAIMLDKFMRHIDEGLSILLKAYPLPVFLMGTSRTTGHFKKLTRNTNRIIGVIHGSFGESSEEELLQAVQPHIADWSQVKGTDLLRQLEAASDAHKLVSGMQEVWIQASAKKGRLLVVEKNYMYPARQGKNKESIHPMDDSPTNEFYIKDAVDDVIEKVLANGGDVEFVNEGVLDAYSRIALVLYY
jgi:hypothetical protein